jgi:L-2,4-diaminobutyrate decarboxylase
MDPPTPWITWAVTLWNASLNQNLLHPATAPVARQLEEQVVAWLAPFFGMNGGHMTPGSSVANLTALWSARECAGITEVIASDGAHLSIAKAAHILGLKYLSVPIDANGSMEAARLPTNLSKSALVLTAGATSTGAIDPFDLAGRAAWTHVDAAWAGPLRVSNYANLLAGIESADSVAVSAHKWLFQPKESALVLFKDTEKAHAAVSFGGAGTVQISV